MMRWNWVGFGVAGLVIVFLLISSCSSGGAPSTKPTASRIQSTEPHHATDFYKVSRRSGGIHPEVTFMLGAGSTPISSGPRTREAADDNSDGRTKRLDQRVSRPGISPMHLGPVRWLVRSSGNLTSEGSSVAQGPPVDAKANNATTVISAKLTLLFGAEEDPGGASSSSSTDTPEMQGARGTIAFSPVKGLDLSGANQPLTPEAQTRTEQNSNPVMEETPDIQEPFSLQYHDPVRTEELSSPVIEKTAELRYSDDHQAWPAEGQSEESESEGFSTNGSNLELREFASRKPADDSMAIESQKPLVTSIPDLYLEYRSNSQIKDSMVLPSENISPENSPVKLPMIYGPPVVAKTTQILPNLETMQSRLAGGSKIIPAEQLDQRSNAYQRLKSLPAAGGTSSPVLSLGDRSLTISPVRPPVVSADEVDSKETPDSVVHFSAQMQKADSAQVTASVAVAEETTAKVILSDEMDTPPIVIPVDNSLAMARAKYPEISDGEPDPSERSASGTSQATRLLPANDGLTNSTVRFAEISEADVNAKQGSVTSWPEMPGQPLARPSPDVEISFVESLDSPVQDKLDLEETDDTPLYAAMVQVPEETDIQEGTDEASAIPAEPKPVISEGDASSNKGLYKPPVNSVEMASTTSVAPVPVPVNPMGSMVETEVSVSSDAAEPIRLSRVSLQDVGPSIATVVIESDKPISNYRSFALTDPPRLVVDIPEAIPSLSMEERGVARGPIKKIQSFAHDVDQKKTVRVVMELSSQLPPFPRLPYHIQSGPGPFQIVVGQNASSQPAVTPVASFPAPPKDPESLPETPELVSPEFPDGLPGLGVRISVDLRQMDILAVMKFLAKEGNLNIVTGKNVGGRISLTLKDVTVQDILDITALSYELAYVVQNGIIHVMTEADYTRLFGAPFADQRKVRTLQLGHADANAVAALLNNMKSAVGRVIGDPQTRTLVLIDVPEKLEPMVTAAQNMDQATRLQTQVFELRFGKAEDIQPEVEKVLTPNLGGVRLDKRTNTLVVTDLVPRMNDVQRVLRAFDRQTREVNIESKIVQVRLDDKFKMGVNWEVLFQQLSDLRLQGTFPISPPVGPAGPVGKLTVGTLADDDFTAVIELLQTVGKTNVLSTPQIAVVENEEAKILVGTREAFVTSVVTQTQQAATTAEEVTFVDVGVSLTAIPKINREGYVTMKIKPEVSSVTRTLTTASGNQIPIVQTSTAESTVMVKDGVTIIIAGLIEDQSIEKTNKVPLLGDIPFLGAAFRSREDEVIKSELVIFLTPTIISGKESVAKIPSSAP